MAFYGSVWSCGVGNLALGHSSNDTVYTPKQCSFAEKFSGIGISNTSSFAIGEKGLFFWGDELIKEKKEFKSPTMYNYIPYGTQICKIIGHPERSCVFLIDENGLVWSWGDGTDYLTALGTELPVDTPLIVVGFDSPVVKITLGKQHGIALTDKSSVYTWGIGKGLGNGLLNNSYHPTPLKLNDFNQVNSSHNIVVDVCAAGDFSLALTKNGDIYFWGSLVESEVLEESEEVSEVEHEKPRLRPTLLNLRDLNQGKVVQIAAGNHHCLALFENGTVCSWGATLLGLGLGDIEIEGQVSPTVIKDLNDIKYIWCFLDSCFALSKNNTLYAWGANSWAQLGVGNSSSLMSPEKVDFPPNVRIADIKMGLSYTLFLTGNENETPFPVPLCVKANTLNFNNLNTSLFNLSLSGSPLTNNLLESNNNNNNNNTSEKNNNNNNNAELKYPLPPPSFILTKAPLGELWVTGHTQGTGNEIDTDAMIVFTPAKSLRNKTVVSASVAKSATFVVTSDGAVWVWGRGTLGLGASPGIVLQPTRLWDLDGTRLTHVFASPNDCTFLITHNGAVYSWGNSNNYVTGHESESIILYPTLLENFHTAVVKIAIGTRHVLALTDDGKLYSWGTGEGLGNGMISETERCPRKIMTVEDGNICDICAGEDYSMLLTKQGVVLTWGDGKNGKLGHGNELLYPIPTPVKRLMEINSPVIQIATGVDFSFALLDNGDVYSWGNATNGNLGLGYDTDSLLPHFHPTRIPSLSNITYITSSFSNTFCISLEGGLYAWGLQHLGIGSGRLICAPVRIFSLQKHRVLGVAGGEWQTIAWIGPFNAKSSIPTSKLFKNSLVSPTKQTTETNTNTPNTKNKTNATTTTTITSTTTTTSSEPVTKKPVEVSSGSQPSEAKVKPEENIALSKLVDHQDILKKIPRAHKFSKNDETDYLALCGRVSEITSFLNGPEGLPVPKSHVRLLEAAQATLPKDETLIKSWVVYSINKRDMELPRVLMVSNLAHYRIKLDLSKESVAHVKRFTNALVHQVLVGKFKDHAPSISSGLRVPLYDKQCGMQIWLVDPASWTPPAFSIPFQSVEMPFFTYRPYVDEDTPIEEQEKVLFEISLALGASIHAFKNGLQPIEYMQDYFVTLQKRFANRPVHVCKKEEQLNRFAGNGLTSFVHNKFLKKFLRPTLTDNPL